MTSFFEEPTVRLFLRAALVAAVTFGSKWVDSSGHVTYSAAALHGALVASGLAFAEIFTPINQVVGIFRGATTPAVLPVPVEPPGDTTEAPTRVKKP